MHDIGFCSPRARIDIKHGYMYTKNIMCNLYACVYADKMSFYRRISNAYYTRSCI